MGRRGGMCKRAFETVSPKNYTCPAAEMGRTPIWGVRLWEEAGAHRLAVATCRWSTPANPPFRFDSRHHRHCLPRARDRQQPRIAWHHGREAFERTAAVTPAVHENV